MKLNVLVQILPIIVVIICILIAIYGNIKLFTYKNEAFMKKRSYTFLLNFIMINGMILITMAYIFASFINFIGVTICVGLYFAVLFVIFYILNVQTWYVP